MVKIFNKIEEVFASLLLVFMTILVFVEIIARFFFNYGITWSQELSLIMNSWLVLIGASYCIREKAHIGVDFLTDKLNKKYAYIVAVLALLSCLAYSGIFLYGSIIYLWEDYQIGIDLDDIPIKTWIPATILIIGFSLINFRFLQAFYRIIEHNDIHVLQHRGEVEDSMKIAKNLLKDKK